MTISTNIVPALAGALAARGYDTLTAVQTAVLAPEAAGVDLLVSAQTGSGKTVAFGIAIAPTLLGGVDRFEAAGAPVALVIAPTRELAVQVRREFEWLYRDTGARIGSCVGGMDMRQERRALEQGAHIVVGTPGRLRDHITRGSLDISQLRAVVLDEADEMLDLGFREDLEFILAAAPAERRTLLFSATVPKPIAALAKRFQRDALRITATSENDQHDDIEYRTILVAPSDRENAIINSLLYFDAQNTLVFCATREAVRHLASRLANRGFSVVSLSGELSQAERTNALQAMRDGRARVCVATDVAARGIDLPNLDLVIHADLPSNPETLLHRSGRTGRAGRKGICALIVPYHRRGSAARLLKLAKLEATSQPAPGPAEIDRKNHERILADPSLSEAAGEDESSFASELLAAYSAEQIAVAFVRQQLASRPAAEELSEGAPPVFDASKGERPDTRFENGVWFSISLGRKHRAEPRWLLPLICKAGNVTKREIGSIRILDTESRFEIVADRADGFAAAVRQGTGEKGVVIQRAEAVGKPERPAGSWAKKPHRKGPSSHAPRPGHDGAPKDRPGEKSRPGKFKPKKFKPKKPPAKT
ncbi:DEAD/DEAH box helicase [Mesorhizobium sp. YM1C-6-2]|uniref:DEAD/DEAH box helicase n=1 Tax=Mesorhizobium sp. YM1C-6-2 TaxID=1827501 RepID=UPI000EF25124|nr:DEAD/DEAH box helicase [Mesorhizobium sp. YM1C-6-2]RLP26240.1 DEAD/DEAH box helicase [Mesorhizobium sp. YM1C-6-2]